MNPAEQKQFENPKKERGCSVFFNGDKKKDALSYACLVLRRAGFSERQITSLRFPSSHHTVNSYVNEAVDLIEAGVIEILPHGKGVNKQHVYMPEKNLEILNANIHENECGGGKRVKTSFNAEERDPWDYELPTSSSRSHFVS
jgi:hypothetical protein